MSPYTYDDIHLQQLFCTRSQPLLVIAGSFAFNKKHMSVVKLLSPLCNWSFGTVTYSSKANLQNHHDFANWFLVTYFILHVYGGVMCEDNSHFVSASKMVICIVLPCYLQLTRDSFDLELFTVY